MFVNKILFQYRSGICLPAATTQPDDNHQILASGLGNLISLGFFPDAALYEALSKMPSKDLAALFQEAQDIIRENLGADVCHTPMYPNFPAQVMEADMIELFLNALIHYCSDGRIVPVYEALHRPPLEQGDYRKLHLCTMEDFHGIFQEMMSSQAILSDLQREDLVVYLSEQDSPRIPSQIPVKETSALVQMTLAQKGCFAPIVKLIKTPTDLLRFAQVLSRNGDETLQNVTHFGPFSRPVRRFMLSVLNGMKSPLEEMIQRRALWLHLGEALHPGESAMQKAYPKAADAFRRLRNGETIETFQHLTEKFIQERNVKALTKLLQKRPGEFARRLDQTVCLAQTDEEKSMVLNRFHAVVGQVSTRVLLQLIQFYMNRNEQTARVFRPARSRNLFVADRSSPALDDKWCQQIIQICKIGLMKQYAERPYLGTVYIDPMLKDISVSLTNRALPDGFRTLPEGSRVKLAADTKILRAFLYWKNEIVDGFEQRCDLDLAVTFMNNDLLPITDVAYYQMRTGDPVFCVHSGDFVSAPRCEGGATEFVDIDIEKAAASGMRYALISAFAYTTIPFDEMETCYIGWMSRKDMRSGEVFEPATIDSMYQLVGERTVLSCVIDLETREVIWMNSRHGTSLKASHNNNGESTRKVQHALFSSMVCRKRFSLYDLVLLHANSHGMLVSNKDHATIVFSMDEGITPFQQDQMLALI